MRENSTLRLCYATASQAGSMSGSRRETAKSVLMVAEGRSGGSDNKGRSALLYTHMEGRVTYGSYIVLQGRSRIDHEQKKG